MARKMKGGSKKGCGCGPNCKCGKKTGTKPMGKMPKSKAMRKGY
jgi:hypothetical protein